MWRSSTWRLRMGLSSVSTTSMIPEIVQYEEMPESMEISAPDFLYFSCTAYYKAQGRIV